jgi:hypothetical protein
MTFQMLLTFCLIATGECHDVRMPLVIAEEKPLPGTVAIYCTIQGQVAGAEWLTTHPAYRFAKWRCGPWKDDA